MPSTTLKRSNLKLHYLVKQTGRIKEAGKGIGD